MSIRAMSWVFDHSRTVGNDRVVALCIADRADDEGFDAWPSIAWLARKANLHKRTVQYCVSNLCALGELKVIIGAGRNGTNIYQLQMDALPIEHSNNVGQPTKHYRRAAPKRKGGVVSAPGGGWHQHRGGGGVGTVGGVVSAPSDPSLRPVRPVRKNNSGGGNGNGAARRVALDPVALAAVQGRAHQRQVLRRIAWEILMAPDDRKTSTGTLTAFLEEFAERLDELRIVATDEHITRAGCAMWDALIRKEHGAAFLRDIRKLRKNTG